MAVSCKQCKVDISSWFSSWWNVSSREVQMNSVPSLSPCWYLSCPVHHPLPSSIHFLTFPHTHAATLEQHLCCEPQNNQETSARNPKINPNRNQQPWWHSRSKEERWTLQWSKACRGAASSAGIRSRRASGDQYYISHPQISQSRSWVR